MDMSDRNSVAVVLRVGCQDDFRLTGIYNLPTEKCTNSVDSFSDLVLPQGMDQQVNRGHQPKLCTFLHQEIIVLCSFDLTGKQIESLIPEYKRIGFYKFQNDVLIKSSFVNRVVLIKFKDFETGSRSNLRKTHTKAYQSIFLVIKAYVKKNCNQLLALSDDWSEIQYYC